MGIVVVTLLGVEGGGEFTILWVNLKNLLWGSVALSELT
jgi:hypothetical protein